MNHPLTLAEMQRIRQWHVAHRDDHPLEYQLWDLLLTLWIMGWLGWLPVYVLDVAWRRRAHHRRRLRCDWL